MYAVHDSHVENIDNLIDAAVKNQNHRLVKKIMLKGVELPDQGNHHLDIAAYNKDYKTINILLENGAKITSNKSYSLIALIQNNEYAIFKKALSSTVNPKMNLANCIVKAKDQGLIDTELFLNELNKNFFLN